MIQNNHPKRQKLPPQAPKTTKTQIIPQNRQKSVLGSVFLVIGVGIGVGFYLLRHLINDTAIVAK
jgi:uncharacterized protein HemX